jgi:glycosyltransferase involved in cell wall biosynthesis
VRVLQVHNRYRERGGEDAVVDAEAALLEDAGHDVVRHLPENPEGAVAAAGRLAVAPWNPLERRRMRALAERVRPDVAHVHNTWFSLTPAAVAGLADAGVPVVVTLHNYRLVCANSILRRDGHPCQDCVGTHPWHGVRHRCHRGSVVSSLAAASTIALSRRERSWLGHVRRFVVLSEFGRDLLVRGGLPAERTVVKPNFVPDHGGRATPPGRSPVVLFVGRLSEEKGLDTLLEGWAAADTGDLRLDVVGDGPLRHELERRSPPGVRFLGARRPDEVAAAMGAARVLAFPTQCFEGQPIVVLEALAAGLPVVCSDLGTTAREMAALGDGLVVPPQSTGAWAAALERVARRHDLDELGRRARARYLDTYTPEVGLRRLEELYAGAGAAA